MKKRSPKTIAYVIAALLVVGWYYIMIPAPVEYSVSEPAPLPASITEWTPEQMEDQAFEHMEAIEVIKDEMRRRDRVEAFEATRLHPAKVTY